MAQMIFLFTDFGIVGPYVGQMKAVLARRAPQATVIDLMHDAPAYGPKFAAYLLAALAEELPPDAIVLGVVDPGVGDAQRRPVVLEAAGRRFVGPDNGLFAVAALRAQDSRWWEITWRPDSLSNTFHGRDLFAPVAAMLEAGEAPPGAPLDGAEAVGTDWMNDLGEIVYIDSFGNAMTGIRSASLPTDAVLKIHDITVRNANTFSDVPKGRPIWYRNSIGLVEIAVNQNRADEVLGLLVGSHVLAMAIT